MKIFKQLVSVPIFFLLFPAVCLMFACTRQVELTEVEPAVDEIAEESLKAAEEQESPKEIKQPEVFYQLDSIANQAELDSFQTRYSDAEKKIIFSLNRMDAWRLGIGDKIVIPDSLSTDLLFYSPFPKKLELLDSVPRAVLISQRVQAFALYEGGELLRWGPVSSGKESTPTPNGLHYGNYKAKRKVSTVNKDWLLPYYFNFMTFEGVGVHEYSMPGYPASHACVRLLEEDSRFIYDWAEQWKLNGNGQVILKNGTPFMVFGDYDFQGIQPWQKLTTDHQINFLQPAELDTLRSYVDRFFSDERNFSTREGEEKVL